MVDFFSPLCVKNIYKEIKKEENDEALRGVGND
jgi:hypothetical protein